MRKILQQRARTAGVGERQRPAADDLPGFVSLAGDEKTIAGPSIATARAMAKALSPISRLAEAAAPARMALADRRGILGAGIVVGDDDAIRQARRDFAHDRPLARHRGRRRSRTPR